MAKLLKIILFLIFITSYPSISLRAGELRVTSYESFAQDKIVAIVNNDVITQKDLDDFVNFMRMQLSQEFKGEKLESKIQSMKLDLLDKLIEDRLILQEAKKEKIKVEESRIKARIEEIKKRYDSNTEFQRALSQQGLTLADIELRIREQLLMYNIIDSKVRSKIVINPTEVTDFYQKNSEKFESPQARRVTSININDENIAKEIFSRLKGGEDLRNIASIYSLSLDEISIGKNGELRKDIEDLVFKLNLGEISPPIKINNNFYIFRLDNIIAPRLQSLSEVRDKIYTFLLEEKMQEQLTQWLDELKEKSYIKILQD